MTANPKQGTWNCLRHDKMGIPKKESDGYCLDCRQEGFEEAKEIAAKILIEQSEKPETTFYSKLIYLIRAMKPGEPNNNSDKSERMGN